MTYIEFFDSVSIENICACLTMAPERVICLGPDLKPMEKCIAACKKVFEKRGHEIEFICKTLPKNDLGKAVSVLTEIVETYENCAFDIMGGEEILNVALGIVYERYPEKNIQVHKFNVQSGVLYDCDSDGETVYNDVPALNIEENVQIYGGDVLFGGVSDYGTYDWNLSDEFIGDVEQMWKICKGHIKFWNLQITIFSAMETVGNCEDGLTTVVSKKTLDAYLEKNRIKKVTDDDIVRALIKNDLLTYYNDDGETVTISYKDLQIKRCLTKAGQALEMKIYATAWALKEKDGSYVYNDALNGVVIDWDGKYHDENQHNYYDTENEVDIMLMKGVIPVFISCKNGYFDTDELYKLSTVAERFGGKYSKKVLITTMIDTFGEAKNHILQRAEDMNITVIKNIQDMTDIDLADELRYLWNNKSRKGERK